MVETQQATSVLDGVKNVKLTDEERQTIGNGLLSFPEIPTPKQYAKLKRTLGMMANFYKNGSVKKQTQMELAQTELEELKVSIDMARAQLKSLGQFSDTQAPSIWKMTGKPGAAGAGGSSGDACPVGGDAAIKKEEGYTIDGCPIKHLTESTPVTVNSDSVHPRVVSYVSELQDELGQLEPYAKTLEERVKEFQLLHKWSLGINHAVQWLERNLDSYWEQVKDYTPTADKPFPDNMVWGAEQITPEQASEYKRGLEEITYNLQESQDFFSATLDGRLTTYLSQEKAAIDAQLEAIRKFPEDAPRRVNAEASLLADLASVNDSLAVNEARHKKMTTMHRDFWDVLRWQKGRLQSMGVNLPDDQQDGALPPDSDDEGDAH